MPSNCHLWQPLRADVLANIKTGPFIPLRFAEDAPKVSRNVTHISSHRCERLSAKFSRQRQGLISTFTLSRPHVTLLRELFLPSSHHQHPSGVRSRPDTITQCAVKISHPRKMSAERLDLRVSRMLRPFKRFCACSREPFKRRRACCSRR